MTQSIAFGTGVSAALRVAVRVSGTTPPASADDSARADPETPSFSVTISQYARDRMKAIQTATAALKARTEQLGEERKAAARQRIENVKQRIELLKKLAVGLGPKAAKSLLNQIRQLAHEIGQAASVLRESSGSATGGSAVSTPDLGSQDSSSAASPGTAGLAEGGMASASEPVVEAAPPVDAAATEPTGSEPAEAAGGAEAAAAQGEAEAAGAQLDAQEKDEGGSASATFAAAPGGQAQRQQDGELIKDAVRKLRQLLAMVKAQLPDDEESRKTLKQVNALLKASEAQATALQVGDGAAALGGVGVNLGAVGSTLSVSV
ncbi:hypothetical protein [Pseudomonas sp. RIT-PI-AD]|uniref:hypothetical protein n=1 Tax=Pseudomonas sp. RIT-PI-AD TaxID=3035294 RepID=UPI0021DAE8C8|nr:hypothetical protein [Pseudomonas sp. RIT-PI-AD]